MKTKKTVRARKKWTFFRSWSQKKSKAIARDRLQVLLVSDRIDCSPEMMEMIKNDIVKVVSKYLEIDEKETEILINQPSGSDCKNCAASICANIPIRRLAHRV